MSSEQKIGRRRTISVTLEDGTVGTTVLETVGGGAGDALSVEA
jgi:hypothetical protein